MPRLSFKSYVFLFVITVILLGVGVRYRPYTIVNEHPKGLKLIALGDSLTAGVGAPVGEGYVEKLEDRIGRPILNRGVSGDTTEDALRRLESDVLEDDPGIVLILLGGNDQLRQQNTDVMIGNLREIIHRIQEKGALVILIGLGATPVNPMLGERYRSLARETGCPFVPDILDGIFGNRELMADQLHPNVEGYSRMADRIAPILQEYLE